jgi:hypothetical protein
MKKLILILILYFPIIHIGYQNSCYLLIYNQLGASPLSQKRDILIGMSHETTATHFGILSDLYDVYSLSWLVQPKMILIYGITLLASLLFSWVQKERLWNVSIGHYIISVLAAGIWCVHFWNPLNLWLLD